MYDYLTVFNTVIFRDVSLGIFSRKLWEIYCNLYFQRVLKEISYHCRPSNRHAFAYIFTCSHSDFQFLSLLKGAVVLLQHQ